MNFESLSAGGASGILGSVLAFFGFKQRIDTIEVHAKQCMEDAKQRIKALEDNALPKNQHMECQKATNQQLSDIKHWMEVISGDIKELMKK